jgi:hypothetical protein
MATKGETMTKEPLFHKVYEENQVERLVFFRKFAGYLSSMFRCTICFHERVYGWGKPESTQALLLCEGKCIGKHTWHSFTRVNMTRESDNFAGISSNT